MYSIKAITSLTGLTPETLRAWERRYDCISPVRSDSGRRSYSHNDLEKLKLLASLTREGHAISKIAGLNCDDLRHIQQQGANDPRRPDSAIFEEIVDALKHYRIERCEQLLKRALIAHEPLDYVRNVLLPALQKVGQLWHDDKLNIAQEHLFSSCVKRLVMAMVNNLHHPSRHQKSILLATPSGEPHEFGILLCSLIAASLQMTCYYLGVNLPMKDILDAVRHLQPDVMVLGVLTIPPEQETLAELEVMRQFMQTNESRIWLGGHGARHWLDSHPDAAPQIKVLEDIDHFHAQCQVLLAQDG
ncbi:MAG: MerR family transcriptional regulator [Methylomonas sp.]|nr:MerR family transcriptional regulator [Methylomonas sp.]PPD22055.1 MAG: MerR family transcriptional regulator [Methylomonas sp.]PPD25247.1 MAG: MerR family transcriptional regulator [Methylomonas sp.]PPD35198.1 MAG: MerR family transcriptional regulator [Methylomonas sp.]PPD42457.1 MAG: MerR family transcriptional regulator [Methylomonas sp.]